MIIFNSDMVSTPTPITNPIYTEASININSSCGFIMLPPFNNTNYIAGYWSITLFFIVLRNVYHIEVGKLPMNLYSFLVIS